MAKKRHPVGPPPFQATEPLREGTHAAAKPKIKVRPSSMALDVILKPFADAQIVQSVRKRGLRVGDEARSVSPAYRFERVGAVWHTRCETDKGDFSDNRFAGLEYVAKVFAKPHTPVPVTDLYPMPAMPADKAEADRTFDNTAKGCITVAERRLEAQIKEAVEEKAEARALELGQQLQRLKDAKKRDSSLRGKARRLNQTATEKAADCVRKAIAALKVEFIHRGLTILAAHTDYIKKETTTFTYRPPLPAPVWTVSP
jgi:hypothetical protein